MPTNITNLTQEQVARMPEWRGKWLKIGLSTEPGDLEAGAQAMRNMYASAKLKQPRVVLRMSSPYGAIIGGLMAEALLSAKVSGAQVRDQVGDQVGAQVGDQVVAQVGARWTNSLYQSFDAGFHAWITYFRDVCDWENPTLVAYANHEILSQHATWSWWAPDVGAISDKPDLLSRDDQGRLHSTTGPAIRFRDGWAIYAVHGVRMPSDIFENRASLTVARIEAERNAEIRRVMIDLYGPARYLKDSGAQIVHSLPADHPIVGLRSAVLMIKTVPDDETIVVVDLLNSTPEPDGTVKRYQLRVDPTAYDGMASRDCHAAAASTWRNADGSLVFRRYQDYTPAFES